MPAKENVKKRPPVSVGNKEKAVDMEMQHVAQEVLRLVEASREGRLADRGNTSEFRGASLEVIQGINTMLDAILLPIGEGNRILAQISNGKIDELIAQTYKGDHEKMKLAVNNVALVLQGLQKELVRLNQASKDGELSERGEPEAFEGAYAEIVRGMNAMLDAILLPIGEGNRILAQISNGKIDELIAQTYKGDHEKMKLAVNNVALVLQGLQKELVRLNQASKDGELSERGKPEAFQGAYAEIIRDVNVMLDAILLPIGEGNSSRRAAGPTGKLSSGAQVARQVRSLTRWLWSSVSTRTCTRDSGLTCLQAIFAPRCWKRPVWASSRKKSWIQCHRTFGESTSCAAVTPGRDCFGSFLNYAS
jgi:methyl-accepting chemotaxis protein